jgi:hypothetical protein
MANAFGFAALREIIIKTPSLELLENKMLKEFRCERDQDVEAFIHNKAIFFENNGLSRTYLYLDGDNLSNLKVAAYFTTAITVTNFMAIPKSRREKILGSTPGRNNQDYFAGLLVAQLARSDDYSKAEIDGAELLGTCESIIEQGRNYLGGKIIYLDAKEPLVGFYRENGYELLNNEPEDNGLFKLFKVLPKLI